MNNTDPNDVKAAENSAANLIRFRMRSEKELSERLREKGFSEETIKTVTEKLKKHGIIDDVKFSYLMGYEKATLYGKGKIFIKNYLLQLGVEKYTVYDTIEKLDQEVNFYNYALEEAKKLIKLKKEKNKVVDSLMRKGYEYTLIEYVIKDLTESFKEP